MRKLGGILAIAALALTACSAPETQPSIQPFAAQAPSTTATISPSATPDITAAPIAPKAAAETEAPATGDFGDPATDAAFLTGVKEGWTGPVPSDAEFKSAAKLACQEFQAGVPYREMRLVAGTTNEDAINSIRIAVYASRNYCTDYNTDTH